VRGIAYFRNNSLQVAGNPYLHENDEIIINDKPFLLKKRKVNFSSKSTIGLFAAAMFIILAVIAAQFMRSDADGNGNIVGVILDQNGRPYLEAAQVRLTELDEYTTTNSQGFFKFDNIPTGTYEIAYQLGEQYIGFGNATVTEGQATLATYSDLESLDEYYADQSGSNAQKKNEAPVTSKPKTSVEVSKSSATPEPTPKKSTTSPKAATKKSLGYGKVKLLANVDNARITVDGKILGSGNNTYSKIKSGTRSIKVDKAGYETYSQKIKISKNKSRTLEVNLNRLASVDETLTADNYLAMGDDNIKAGKLSNAIKDYAKAIELSPSNLSAYEKRADAYVSSDNKTAAVKDYIRAGEIQRMSGKPSASVRSFNRALEYSPKNYSALIGRAGAHGDMGDYRSASVDYNTILDKDKKDFQALYGSGVCYFKLGNHKKAQKVFKEAYKINKSDQMLYQYMLLTYMARDEVKKLRKLYAEYKLISSPQEFAEFKSNTRFEPVIRLIKEEDR